MNRDTYRLVVECLCRGVREEARRLRCSPFDWKAYGQWLRDLHGDDEELVLAVLRDRRVRLRVVDGVATLQPRNKWRLPMRCPSRAGALFLAGLVELWCGVVPSDRAVRRTMAILEARALGSEAA